MKNGGCIQTRPKDCFFSTKLHHSKKNHQVMFEVFAGNVCIIHQSSWLPNIKLACTWMSCVHIPYMIFLMQVCHSTLWQFARHFQPLLQALTLASLRVLQALAPYESCQLRMDDLTPKPAQEVIPLHGFMSQPGNSAIFFREECALRIFETLVVGSVHMCAEMSIYALHKSMAFDHKNS